MTREERIAGLRAIADLLERIPELPVYEFGYPSFALDGDDEEAFAAIDAATTALTEAGIPFTHRESPGHAGVEIEVAGMQYRFSRIDQREWAQVEARRSYDGNIQADPESEPVHLEPIARGPLTAYMDAVAEALPIAGVGVLDCSADEHRPSITITLARLDRDHLPLLTWTPAAGWCVMLTRDGEPVHPETARYVGLESVPDPEAVAAIIGRWVIDPGNLSRTEPVYGAMVTGTLAERLAWRAGR